MAANRGDSFAGALSRVWGRGGVLGCKLRLETPYLCIHSALINSYRLPRPYPLGLDRSLNQRRRPPFRRLRSRILRKVLRRQ